MEDKPISNDATREAKIAEKGLSFLDMASDSDDQDAIALIDQIKEIDNEYGSDYLKTILTF